MGQADLCPLGDIDALSLFELRPALGDLGFHEKIIVAANCESRGVRYRWLDYGRHDTTRQR
jgi:hypothetical protein